MIRSSSKLARGLALLSLAIGAAIAVGPGDAGAEAPIPPNSPLHEYVAPDANEDVSFAATTLDGNLPAALDTPSGIATAPDPTRPPDAKNLYSGGTSDDSPNSTYEPDRDTRQPQVENYDDPFSPSTSPFKRLRAFDTVDPSYTLRVAHSALSVLTVGGQLASDDEPFYADFSVDLLPDEPVRIPSVGPGARVLKLHTTPEASTSLLHDGADNWFIRGTERKRVRVVMELAITRATFGSQIAETSWERLAPFVPPQPEAHAAAAQRVLEHIGVSRSMSVPQATAKLVDYFRSFAPSTDTPHDQADIYLDLALSKKGVCRHRAFAFLVTALHLGLPARMVVNEAHAWVEVYDGSLWHRIDLGGAAQNLDDPPDPSKPQYQPPPDPYAWPDNAQQGSGQGLASRMRQNAGIGDPSKSSPNGSQNDPNGSSTPPVSTPSASAADSSTPPRNDLPPTKLELESVEKNVRRGTSLHVRGKAEGTSACRNIRIDVRLRSDAHPNGIPIGSLSTDDAGVYDGSVVVPRDLAAGDYELVLSTPGDARCGPGTGQ
jgi:hypothetical protein